MSAAGQCRDCEHFDRDAGGTDGVCLDGRSWRFEVTERWDTKATDTCEFFAAKKLRDLHGEAAEALGRERGLLQHPYERLACHPVHRRRDGCLRRRLPRGWTKGA